MWLVSHGCIKLARNSNLFQPWKRLLNWGVKVVKAQEVDPTNCQQQDRATVLHRYFGGNIDQVDCGFHSSRCYFTRGLF